MEFKGFFDLINRSVKELYEIAKEYDVKNYAKLNKKELIYHILDAKAKKEGLYYKVGVLDIKKNDDKFCGFIRFAHNNYVQSNEDIYVSPQLIKKYALRKGDVIGCFVKPNPEERNDPAYEIDFINWMKPEEAKNRPYFDELIPFYPTEKFELENPDDDDVSMRVVDLFVPIGKGQRGLIVSPPRAGKTVLLQKIAKSIIRNHIKDHPEDKKIKLIMLLIDERPEEVTEMKQIVNGYADVISSTFDQPAERHVHVADIVIEHAKRLVEIGKDVVILLDSITRLTRAHNAVVPSSGKTMTGGLDPSAIVQPKKFFGSARNILNGGSLTIIATALIDTGSRMDEVIFEEFKGTGNMELVLDRRLADRRIFPAIDIHKSGTRREELLLPKEVLEKVRLIRQQFATINSIEAMIRILKEMNNTSNNREFLEKMVKEGEKLGISAVYSSHTPSG